MQNCYIWQHPIWPAFTWNAVRLSASMSAARLAQGRLQGKVASLGIDLHQEQRISVLIDEAVQTSAIEGEFLDPQAVRSSVMRRLGLLVPGNIVVPRHVDGLVEVLLDATTNADIPLTSARIRSWHEALFPTGQSGMYEIVVGNYRPAGAPMRVVSGPVGRERVHFEAPPGERVALEMDAFLDWFAQSRDSLDGLIRAGIAHFRFVTIHPFMDGNGRLARAVGEMALTQDEGIHERLYSLSAQIESNREPYYRALEQAQRGTGDLTDWIDWFLRCLTQAIERSETKVNVALAGARFWQQHAGKVFNERQVKFLRRVLEAGPDGFEGGLTTRKIVHLVKVSSATAQRDLANLVEQGVIIPNKGRGRGTSYRLVGY